MTIKFNDNIFSQLSDNFIVEVYCGILINLRACGQAKKINWRNLKIPSMTYGKIFVNMILYDY